MNSALQPQLLKLEEAFDETVKAGTTNQEELESAILLRQLKSYLNLTICDNVQYSTLRDHLLQWDRSQQKWATSMVASRSTDYQGPMPMGVDRVQDAKGKGKKGKNDHQKGKGKDAKGKGKKGKLDQKGKESDHKGKGKCKDQKGTGGVATCYTCGKPGHLAKDCWRNNIRQVASDPTHSSSGGASMTTHAVGQQHANVSH